jgi:hypothetical protein
LDKEQEIFRVPWQSENASGIRQNVSGIGTVEDTGGNGVGRPSLDKSFTSRSKSRGKIKISNKHEECEQIHESDTFQNGRGLDSERSNSERRLRCDIRSERGLQPRSSASFNATVTRSDMERKMLQIPKHAIWFERRSIYVHKNNEEGCSIHKGDVEHKSSYLSRRYCSPTSGFLKTRRGIFEGYRIPVMVGVDSQRRKVSPDSNKAVQILGMAMEHIGFNSAVNEGTQRKSLRIFEGSKEGGSSSLESDNKSTRKMDWNIEFYSSSVSASKSRLSKVKSFKNQGSSHERMGQKNSNNKRSDIRIDSIVSLNKKKQPSRHNEIKAISSNNNNGCGPHGGATLTIPRQLTIPSKTQSSLHSTTSTPKPYNSNYRSRIYQKN